LAGTMVSRSSAMDSGVGGVTAASWLLKRCVLQSGVGDPVVDTLAELADKPVHVQVVAER